MWGFHNPMTIFDEIKKEIKLKQKPKIITVQIKISRPNKICDCLSPTNLNKSRAKEYKKDYKITIKLSKKKNSNFSTDLKIYRFKKG